VIGPFRDQWRFLSNFWPEPRRRNLTNEHFYQAGKALNLADRAQIMAAETAGEAKRLGRLVVIRPDWEDVKETVMMDGLRTKFFSDESLADMLLVTGDEHLVEVNTWGDTYWGVCNGRGLNRLGELLMEVREELQLVRSTRA
jgi:ribA/ribD-fused uncharacterized protein